MTDLARPEIVIKFNQIPTAVTQNSGKTSFTLQDAKGQVYQIICSSKSFNKATKTIATFTNDYVVSCSSKEFTIQNNQVVMEQCGLQVFEKKPKEPTD